MEERLLKMIVIERTASKKGGRDLGSCRCNNRGGWCRNGLWVGLCWLLWVARTCTSTNCATLYS